MINANIFKLMLVLILFLPLSVRGENEHYKNFPIKIESTDVYEDCLPNNQFKIIVEKSYKNEKLETIAVYSKKRNKKESYFVYPIAVNDIGFSLICLQKGQEENAIIGVTYGYDPCTGSKYRFRTDFLGKYQDVTVDGEKVEREEK